MGRDGGARFVVDELLPGGGRRRTELSCSRSHIAVRSPDTLLLIGRPEIVDVDHYVRGLEHVVVIELRSGVDRRFSAGLGPPGRLLDALRGDAFDEPPHA